MASNQFGRWSKSPPGRVLLPGQPPDLPPSRSLSWCRCVPVLTDADRSIGHAAGTTRRIVRRGHSVHDQGLNCGHHVQSVVRTILTIVCLDQGTMRFRRLCTGRARGLMRYCRLLRRPQRRWLAADFHTNF
jgi:hypothetical protein